MNPITIRFCPRKWHPIFHFLSPQEVAWMKGHATIFLAISAIEQLLSQSYLGIMPHLRYALRKSYRWSPADIGKISDRYPNN